MAQCYFGSLRAPALPRLPSVDRRCLGRASSTGTGSGSAGGQGFGSGLGAALQHTETLARSPNALKTGDVIWLPDDAPPRRWFAVKAGTAAKFVVAGQRRPFSLLLRSPTHEPIKSSPYCLKVGKLVIEGSTDADGMLTTEVPKQLRGFDG